MADPGMCEKTCTVLGRMMLFADDEYILYIIVVTPRIGIEVFGAFGHRNVSGNMENPHNAYGPLRGNSASTDTTLFFDFVWNHPRSN